MVWKDAASTHSKTCLHIRYTCVCVCYCPCQQSWCPWGALIDICHNLGVLEVHYLVFATILVSLRCITLYLPQSWCTWGALPCICHNFGVLEMHYLVFATILVYLRCITLYLPQFWCPLDALPCICHNLGVLEVHYLVFAASRDNLISAVKLFIALVSDTSTAFQIYTIVAIIFAELTPDVHQSLSVHPWHVYM